MFSIEILDEPCDDPDLDALGRISIGAFSEMIGICFIDGDKSKSINSWHSELRDLIAGKSAVALRTQPMRAWLLWREKERVYVQEHLVIAGIMIWVAVTIWDFQAPELTPLLFWVRLLAPLVSSVLFIIALCLLTFGIS